jgi:hypothetical protein
MSVYDPGLAVAPAVMRVDSAHRVPSLHKVSGCDALRGQVVVCQYPTPLSLAQIFS